MKTDSATLQPTSSIRSRSLLAKADIVAPEPGNQDCYVSSSSSERSWGKALAFAGMGALSLAPTMVQAKDVGDVITQHAPELGELFQKNQTQVGDYKLTFQAADLNINPGFRGLKPGLKVRGDLLKTEFAKTEKAGDLGWIAGSNTDWTVTTGIRGGVYSEFRTNGDSRATVNLEAFKRWNGTISGDVKGMFEVSGGTYHNILDQNSSVGFQARQEIKGGSFDLAGRHFHWGVDGRQSVGRVISGQPSDGQSRNNWSYEVMVGVRHDYPVKLFGRQGNLQLTAGPEFRGNQNEHFKVAPKVRARLNF